MQIQNQIEIRNYEMDIDYEPVQTKPIRIFQIKLQTKYLNFNLMLIRK